jgi:hypothetical protein
MSNEKKIIIDEDWKSQVQAERDSLAAEAKKTRTAGPGATGRPESHSLPPASFEMLLSTLATEAMIALGQIPHPAVGQYAYDADQAKYLIDTISVLKEKTAGNLTPMEQQAIDGLLHQLRMAFLAGPPPTTSTVRQSPPAPAQPGRPGR